TRRSSDLRDLEIADNRRPVAGAKRKSERRDGIERLKDVALTIDDGAAKRRIKVMLLDNAPRNQLLRLPVAVLPKKPLRKAILDFAGVGQRRIGIETHKLREAIHSGYVPISDSGCKGMLVPPTGLVLVQGSVVT